MHNLGMESMCSLVGHRTGKTKTLEATSRSVIIQGTKELREKYGGSFHDFSQATKRVKQIKLKWRAQQEEIAGQKMSAKQANNLKVEVRVLKQLEYLKSFQGPFTKCDEIDSYLMDETISSEDKKKRLKTEVQYARDTSLSVPKNNKVFKIRTSKLPGKGSVELSPTQFGGNLKLLIDKKNGAPPTSLSQSLTLFQP